MNLLVTNAQDKQAYIIVRSLRDHFERIVVTTGSESVGGPGFPGLAAFSRHVDHRVAIPRFSDDWLAGLIGRENTPSEEAYVIEIERICQERAIDVIYPSLDPEVYLFSKNKERFQAQGILCVAPEYEVLEVPFNKARTMRACAHAGFPIPNTFFPKSAADLDRVVRESHPPWVIKPRYGAHSSNLQFADDEHTLRQAFNEIEAIQPEPLIQEYVGGNERCNYYAIVGRDSELLSLLNPESVRTWRSGKHYALKTARSRASALYREELCRLISELGLWGAYTIQAKIDPLDGQPKLLEINPRLGHHLWFRTELGVNEPLMFLQLAQGKIVEPRSFPEGVLLVDPLHDFFYVSHCLVETVARKIGRPPRLDWDANLVQAISEVKADYWNGESKVYCPEFRYFLDDPSPMLRLFLHTLGGRLRRRAPKLLLKLLKNVHNRIFKRNN